MVIIFVLALGFGLESATANVLSLAQAKTAADQISASFQYNSAYAIARDITANTGAQDAAFNAQLIARFLTKKDINFLVAIINGVSFNYPNQQAAIINQIVGLDGFTRKNAAKIVILLSPHLSSDAISQLAATLNFGFIKSGLSREKAWLLAFSLLNALNNNFIGTEKERGREMAITAATLAANLLTPNRHGGILKDNRRAFDQIVYAMGGFARNGDPEVINVFIAYFAKTLAASVPGGRNNARNIRIALNHFRLHFLARFPSSAPIINKIIQDILKDPVGYDPAGTVSPPESPTY
jgi:hypothetical protein